MRVFIASSLERFDGTGPLFEELDAMRNCKPVRTRELHLTFRFFGDVGDKNLKNLVDEFSALDCRKFTSRIHGLGAFPGLKKANVLFFNVDPSDAISHNWTQISRITPENTEARPFIPHITIARFRKPEDCADISERYAGLSHSKEMERISIYSSVLTRNGPEYTELESIQLK